MHGRSSVAGLGMAFSLDASRCDQVAGKVYLSSPTLRIPLLAYGMRFPSHCDDPGRFEGTFQLGASSITMATSDAK